MTAPADLQAARARATRRRAAGVASDFDPTRLALARRLAGMQRTAVARAVGVTPAAVTQFEKGQTKPTLPVLAALSEALGVSPEFFRTGIPVQPLPAAAAHFRSLRSTSALEREKSLAFAELAVVVFDAVERHVELPAVTLPELDVPPDLTLDDVARLAQEARVAMGLGTEPVPNMVRLLEAHGVAVLQLDDATRRVDAFSHQSVVRPLVLLNPLKGDKARSRFDAAHELGHLLMHLDTEPGSRLVEDQAHAFAAEFLTPAAQIGPALPRRLDWPALHELKRRWGVSLKALVVRSYKLERIGDATYQRALRELSSWGIPEPGPLGPPEVPVLLSRALDALDEPHAVRWLSEQTYLPEQTVLRVLDAGGHHVDRPAVTVSSLLSH
jgi:Zn-dependent peptidase ImmA (M78 family)/transcriptional regulator with XRE-family HTH domain